MSGGVDSTVAAQLLIDQGYDVEGLTFWLWSYPGAPDYKTTAKCCSLDDAALAAEQIGIPHRTIDASGFFYDHVVRDYIDRYSRGETPNPCGYCNRYVRFGLALQYAREHGFDHIATGHHVRLFRDERGSFHLLCGLDPHKDQTYFLYGLQQDHLSQSLFPVGELTKKQVFAIAQRKGLHSASLPESQDLCFAIDASTDFLFPEGVIRPGPIVNTKGERLGTHNGYVHYTIGQRRNLGVASSTLLYVVEIDAQANTIVVGEEKDLYWNALSASEASYTSGQPLPDGVQIQAKIRYRSPAFPATYHPIENNSFCLNFRDPQRAVTKGQIVALYKGEELIGGGVIEGAIKEQQI
jgi:tRNA-uridine 2-sulfurtransferase